MVEIKRRREVPYDYVLAKARFKKDGVCQKCLGAGVLRVHIDDIGTLALCDCDVGGRMPWDLPIVEIWMKHQALPVDQFKPPFQPKTQTQVNHFIREKISWWKEKIHVAEEFWRNRKVDGQ